MAFILEKSNLITHPAVQEKHSLRCIMQSNLPEKMEVLFSLPFSTVFGLFQLLVAIWLCLAAKCYTVFTSFQLTLVANFVFGADKCSTVGENSFLLAITTLSVNQISNRTEQTDNAQNNMKLTHYISVIFVFASKLFNYFARVTILCASH